MGDDTTTKKGALDPTSPFYLHPSDHPGLAICPVILKGDNYQEWNTAMRNAFRAKRKIGFIDGKLSKPAVLPKISSSLRHCFWSSEMERIESTPSIPFRSKKPSLQGTPKKPSNLLQEDLPAMLETPEKSSRPPRVRNTNMALSIKDVKRTAQLLRKRDLNRSDPLESLQSVSDLQMQVPEKARRGAAKSVEGSVKLPEKYLMLCEFFNVMVSVIPLLRMRRMSLTFSNICPKIQSMTDRRFTINHLAQLKYILPEAILVKRIRLRDEKTDCMKEELLITLDMEAVKVSKNVNDIREMFRARIKDYFEAHSEEDDIPEGELPAMFYQPKQSETSSIDKSSCVASASHVPRSFQTSFSRKASGGKSADQSILGNPTAQLEKSLVSESPLMSNVLATPIKANSVVIKDGFEGSIGIQGTPIKEAFTPIRLMASTPAVKPSKRCYMSPEDDKCDVPTKLIRRANRTRSLKFDPDEDNTMNEVQADDTSGSNLDSDVTDLVPRNLLQSVREKERKILEEQDPAISQARRRHQLMSSLPKLFDMIHLLFQSINRSVLTKEELMFKIITCHCDIVDRGEIEEQLQLLLELAPEYISERLCSSGDTLVRLNKTINPQSVRAKLLQA